MVGVALDLFEPIFNILKRLLISDVINYNDSVRSFVVGGRDSLETLLAGGIPLHRPKREQTFIPQRACKVLRRIQFEASRFARQCPQFGIAARTRATCCHTGCHTHARLSTYKVDANRADIAFCELSILDTKRVRQVGHCRHLHRRRTANRSRRHDLPTPESPINTSLNRWSL